MHERSLVAALLSQVDEVVAKNGAARAVGVRVSIGEFSGVDAELFRLAFNELSVQSDLAGPELEMETVPLEAGCQECGCAFVVERFEFICPVCASSKTSVRRGEGLMLESVLLEGDLS